MQSLANSSLELLVHSISLDVSLLLLHKPYIVLPRSLQTFHFDVAQALEILVHCDDVHSYTNARTDSPTRVPLVALKSLGADSLDDISKSYILLTGRVDVPFTRYAPHRSGRAAFPHPAPHMANRLSGLCVPDTFLPKINFLVMPISVFLSGSGT